MEIKVLFKKDGVVAVGTNDPNQTINLQNPHGQPISIDFNFKTGLAIMKIKSWDEDQRNSIVRDFEIPLPIETWQAFLANIFAQHIRPLAKASYPEFDGLIDLGVEFIP